MSSSPNKAIGKQSKNALVKRFYLPALFLIGVLWPTSFWKWLHTSERDFGSFWVAGQAIRSGLDPYNVPALKAFGDQLLGVANYNFTYPPHSLFLFLPFSFFTPVAALILWNIVSVIFFWWAARPLIPKGMPTIYALLSPAALINLNYGQTGLISAGLFLMAFRPNGFAAAVLTFKPHLGFLVIPAVLRSRRAFVTTIIATLALVVVSALAFRNWAAFFEHALGFQGKMLIDQTQDLWLFLGTTPAIGYGIWGWLLFAAGGAYFLARNYNVFTAATATFLIAPYGLHYDMAAVCLGFAIMLYSRWDEMPRSDIAAASLAFLTPLLVVYGTTWLVPPLLLWGLAVQTRWTSEPSC
jgi:hypothetical protein